MLIAIGSGLVHAGIDRGLKYGEWDGKWIEDVMQRENEQEAKI